MGNVLAVGGEPAKEGAGRRASDAQGLALGPVEAVPIRSDPFKQEDAGRGVCVTQVNRSPGAR
jgi:hypothetical protein